MLRNSYDLAMELLDSVRTDKVAEKEVRRMVAQFAKHCELQGVTPMLLLGGQE